MKNLFPGHLPWALCLLALSCVTPHLRAQSTAETLLSLSQKFNAPTDEYRPYVWWHWMGSNFSKEGIRKDLEAMKEAGIGGATIFNPSASQAGPGYRLWPENTYRSPAYWDALRFAASEARRLGLKIGLHNTTGYSTTGGPWVTEEKGMQKVVSGKKTITGGQTVKTSLPVPELPQAKGYGSNRRRASFFKDIAVLAVPAGTASTVADIIDITDKTDTDGNLTWDAPAGEWTVVRLAHAATMANPHPLPDELAGKALEVDKMSREANIEHWRNVLDPLKEHLGEYIGDSFTFIMIDSYEAGDQDWTPGFREEFIRLKGYDPLPWLALKITGGKQDGTEAFDRDYKAVVSRLFIDNGWSVARDMIHKAGLKFYWEPYTGPFDTEEAVSLPDVPMGEFWTKGNGGIRKDIVLAAKRYDKRIVGAEAFTGRPEVSKYTEDPAFLKHFADGAFISGVNLMFLHHWVHQPFDDRYQPGMGMTWWGTHFGRHQTWFRPGRAFFTYLSRCQMLLRQGTYVESRTGEWVRRSTPEAEIFFVANQSPQAKKTLSFPVANRTPEIWDAYSGTISEAGQWREQDGQTRIDLDLQPGCSAFVVFPSRKQGYPRKAKSKIVNEKASGITGAWKVSFEPKLDKPFSRVMPALADLSKQDDAALKYFSGTARYEKTIRIAPTDLGPGKRVTLDLGELHDIAELQVNGQDAGVLWATPYKTDITQYLRKGDNKITVSVTNNWANRLIGDEQYPADFEWGVDRGEKIGRAIKDYPDWFRDNRPRPSLGRKTFAIWYYYRKDSPLQPAGLLGPVRLIVQDIEAAPGQ